MDPVETLAPPLMGILFVWMALRAGALASGPAPFLELGLRYTFLAVAGICFLYPVAERF